jgi:uncharacterized protein YecE (DUF72 family)
MGQIQVGTASWTDRTLIAAGWYPPGVNTPEKRLRYYASQFSLAEVDATWMTPGNQQETLDFLSASQLAYVCVDMPQGHKDSIPPVLAATTDLAVVRMHGQSEKWDSKDIQERFGYRYTTKELKQWALRIAALTQDAKITYVAFNNCYRDWAQANAQQLAALLEL